MSDGGVRPQPPRAARSVRVPLSVEQILELDAALLEAFRALHELRDRYRAATHIKFPPLPPVFSESIVIVAAAKLFGPGWKARHGGPACDVLLCDANGAIRSVEVKATGEHAFQELKAKDLRADYLVWVRFGRRFRGGCGEVTIAILEKPG